MSFDSSLFAIDVGYREYESVVWLPRKLVPGERYTWSDRALRAARNIDLHDTDILCVGYPRSGAHAWRESNCRRLRSTEGGILFRRKDEMF